MMRTLFLEAQLRQGRLDAKTLDSMFRRRIEEGANCSPLFSVRRRSRASSFYSRFLTDVQGSASP